MERFSAIWQYNAATTDYTDLTDNTKTNTAINFLGIAVNEFYFGFDRRFIGIYADLSTNGSYTGISYSYYDGSSWKKFSLIDAYTFNTSKYQRWVLPSDWIKCEFTSTFPNAATPPDDNERYWLKVTVTTVTTQAVISKLRVIPFVQYATPNDVAAFLQIKNKFTDYTKPTDLDVENLIHEAEARIDYRTKKSWKFNAVVEETGPQLVDYNRYGVFTRYKNFMKVYDVSLWNGSSWQALTEGRSSDYLVNYDLGMIYFTRLWLLPAAYGMTGRYFHYGFGEFKDSIRLDYIYGRDSEIDPQFYIVKRIATKHAAVALTENHDYAPLISSGTDKVSLESKVRLWNEEIEQELDELTGVSVF